MLVLGKYGKCDIQRKDGVDLTHGYCWVFGGSLGTDYGDEVS